MKYAFHFITILAAITFTASAAPKARFLSGTYQGNCGLQSTAGDFRFYNPIRVRVKKNGKITGTAFLSETGAILRVTGRIRKVKIRFNTIYQGKATGRISDGATWKAEFTGSSESSNRSAVGTCTLGDYLGKLALSQ